ncbi:DnaD domain-containing protein [Alkalihalobacillus sp. AL-G]|uniref:DnaD domain-containing protein n=1 Tax=Alkalihalobacillus sp. AL-G TaxID=2926399 RepID=UPI00272C7133|nr:DnaD domain-containing protein [Alkalihalobacillus sp. AL-G]WLD91790.1 DnaD domain-containing protein [Alkalihalobacillus sp. AL-G]
MKRESFLNWIQAGTIAIPNVLLMNYHRLGVKEDEMMVLLHMHSFIESGNYFPTPEQISSRMTISSHQCMQLLRTCIQKGLLKIEEHQDPDQQMFSETYTLEPLWDKLIRIIEEQQVGAAKDKQIEEETQIYSIVEKEFGRPLSPIECETLAIWIDQDHHKVELIIAALKEAVLSGKLNFRYIDRILFEWKKNGIQTVEDAKQYGEKFRRHRYQRKDTKSESNTSDFPYYNWLEQ